MKEHKGIDSKSIDFRFGKKCTNCQFFKNQGYELCKRCVVYEFKLKYISGSRSLDKNTSPGESLAVLDFAIQDLIKLYIQIGSDWGQIESEIAAIVKENIKLIAEGK